MNNQHCYYFECAANEYITIYGREGDESQRIQDNVEIFTPILRMPFNSTSSFSI